jgi:hypothetical protein
MVAYGGQKGDERERRARRIGPSMFRDVNERVSEIDDVHDLRLALDWVCECAERGTRSSSRKAK